MQRKHQHLIHKKAHYFTKNRNENPRFKARSNLFNKLSASSSVTCPPKSTLLILSDGWNSPQKETLHRRKMHKSVKTSTIFNRKKIYLVRTDRRTRSWSCRIDRGIKRGILRPGEEICCRSVGFSNRAVSLHLLLSLRARARVFEEREEK